MRLIDHTLIHLTNDADPAPQIQRVPLPPIRAMAGAVQDKKNRRPLSMTKRGLIKLSGKAPAHRIAAVRWMNLQIANAQR